LFDELLPRLRARAADPARRTDVRPNQLMAQVQTLDLGGLLSMAGGLADALRGVVVANQAGRVDAAGQARAQELQRQLSTPVEVSPRAPASAADVDRVEAALGVTIPVALRRVYLEIADGGFGPAGGLEPLDGVLAASRELVAGGQLPRDRVWPDGLLPVVARDPGWDCVEASSGRVIAWDPEDLTERASEERFRRSFGEAFPSVEAWLADWLGSETLEEQHARMMAELMSPESQARQAREAREAIGRKSIEERRAMGLPDVGWEKVVWGGVGWEDPEGESGR
jgi:hypothetical protein